MVKETSISIRFPWEQLKAESMRSVCRDLGFKAIVNRTIMTHFLESVSKIGLPRALALDAGSGREEEKKSVLSTPASSRKRTRATANDEHTDGEQQQHRSGSKRQTPANPRPARGGKREQANAGEGEEEEEGTGSGQPSPSKRYRISVTSDYNTRFKADRRGRMSDPGPRGGRRARVSFSATPGRGSARTPGRPSRRGPAARARASARGARMRAVALGGQQDRSAGRRVRLVEPGSSETADENDGDDEGVGGSASAVVVVTRRRVPSVGERKRRVSAGRHVNGVEEEGRGSAKRARRGRLPKSAGAIPDGLANGGPKMVFDGIDVPPLSKAVVEAIRKREMVLYDEDADGEVDETVGEALQGDTGMEGVGMEGVVEEGAGVAEEGAGVSEEGASVSEEGAGVGEEGAGVGAGEENVTPEVAGAPEGVYEAMPVDEGEVEGEVGEEEEDESQLEELIPDDSSSLGNSNKENEAPVDEDMGEDQETIEMEMDTIGATMTNIEEEISGLAAEALFGAGPSTSVPAGPSENDIIGEEDFLT